MLPYIIIPVHNRRNITLKCLERISQLNLFDICHVVVVDDGSTDDTSKAIQAQYPKINLLSGDGNLWWAGAIAKGMEYSMEKGADYLIWLNDDCYLFEDTIPKLLETCAENPQTIVGAKSLKSADDPSPSYGGIARQGFRLRPIYAGECDGLAGNLVCLPQAVVTTIGYPDYHHFPQYFCDVVYTNQAKQQGFKLLVAEDINTYCADDNKSKNWLEKDYSLGDILAQRFSKQSSSYWSARIRYEWQFLGIYGVLRYLFWEWIFKLSFFTVVKLISKFISLDTLKRNLQKMRSS